MAPLCVASCASTSPVRTDTVTVKVPVVQPVAEALTAPVTPQACDLATAADLAQCLLVVQAALDRANAKLKAIAGLK